MAEHDQIGPEVQLSREAQQLLDEFFRIRREYNSLDRNNPAHAGRRAELRDRYFELDRRYTTLIRARKGMEEGAATDQLRSKADVLWEGAFSENEPAGDAEPVDAEWIEMHTPVEGRQTDEVFEEALRRVGTKATRTGGATTVADEEPPDESALEPDNAPAAAAFTDAGEDARETGPNVPDSAAGLATSLGEVDRPNMSAVTALREIAAGFAVDDELSAPEAIEVGAGESKYDAETISQIVPGAPAPSPARPASDTRAARAAGDFHTSRRAPKAETKEIACPSCGELLPAGTKQCNYCHARLISGVGLDAESMRQVTYTALYPPKTHEKPGLGPKVLITLGWIGVLAGATWLIVRATGLEQDRIAEWLDRAGLTVIGEPQAATILGVSVLLLGLTVVGVGVFAGRFVRLVLPIHELARTGRIETIEKLILHGEDIDARDERGCTPLHFAIVAGQREVVAVLVGNGADPNSHNDRGDTPLHLAAANRDHALVQYLLSKGADPRAVNDSGSCLLHVAAWVGDMGLLKMFLEKGLKVDARTKVGFTPLHFAAQSGYYDATRFLLESGANVNAASHLGTTPLFAAVRNGHLPVVELLVGAGADVNVRRDHDFENPLGIAQAHKRAEIAEYLKAHGAMQG